MQHVSYFSQMLKNDQEGIVRWADDSFPLKVHIGTAIPGLEHDVDRYFKGVISIALGKWRLASGGQVSFKLVNDVK